MIKSVRLEGYQVVLRPIELGDVEQVRQWRNSQWVKQFMLTDDDISPEQQRAWFEHISRATNQIHFLIEYKQQAIGSCNIKARGQVVDIEQAKHLELGLYIGEQRFMGNIIAFAPTLLMNDYCFEQLNATQLHAVVKDENQAAMRYNEKLGYRIVNAGQLNELVLTREQYQLQAKPLKAFLNRPRRKNT